MHVLSRIERSNVDTGAFGIFATRPKGEAADPPQYRKPEGKKEQDKEEDDQELRGRVVVKMKAPPLVAAPLDGVTVQLTPVYTSKEA